MCTMRLRLRLPDDVVEDREMVRKMEQVRKTWATGSDTGNTCRDTWQYKYKYF